MSQVPGLGYGHLWGSVILSTTSVSTSHSVLLEVLSGSRNQLLSLQVPKLALLSVHICIVVVEIGLQTLMDKGEREANVSLVTQWASPLLGQGCVVTISGGEENPEH